MLNLLKKDVKAIANPEKAEVLKKFFKTSKGEYAAGDIFYGITVPESRKIAKKYKNLLSADILALLKSPVHEERLIALLIFIIQYNEGESSTQQQIYEHYLAHTSFINNWDLVDCSADKIVGEHLKEKDRSILKRLAHSDNLWERRISIIATFQFIKDQKEYRDTFAIADILLHDQHDLIQKAVGWMLREVGKRISEAAEEKFLKSRYQHMPRTALRYAIERFPEKKRKAYLNSEI